ncbi:MAG: hypothetical protein N3H31_03195 [Candidatus Nezhaarchaeota archaeon]|nr:hypothetical protein [Candidatus Nezhaarchaeota archaeon]
MGQIQARLGGIKPPEGFLCERCEFFQGWTDRLSPRGVKLIRCKAVDAYVQPPYERCSAFKPLRRT